MNLIVATPPLLKQGQLKFLSAGQLMVSCNSPKQILSLFKVSKMA